jgi:autotransporter translocation and assembly factor TamB
MEDRERGKTVLRWAGRIIVGTLLLVLAAVTAILITLNTDYGREKVRARLQTALQERVRGDVEVGGLEGTVLDDVTARDVVIRDAAGDVAVVIDRLRIDYSVYRAAMDQRFSASRIEVEGLSVFDRGTLGTLMISGEEPSAWVVDVAELEVSGGSYRRERPGEEPLVIDDIAVIGGVYYSADETAATVRSASARWRDLAVNLRGLVALADQRVAAEDTTITAGGSRLHIASGILALEGLGFNARVQLRAAAADVRRFAPDLGWRADVNARGRIRRSGAGAPIEAELDGTLGDSPLAASLNFHPGPRRLAGTLSLTSATPRSWLDTLPPGDIDVAAELDVRGTDLASLRGEVALEADGTLAGASVKALSAEISIDGDGASAAVTAARANYGGITASKLELEARAARPLEEPSIQFALRSPRLAGAGAAAETVTIEGRARLASGAGRAILTARRVRRADETIAPVRAELVLSDRGRRVAAELRAGGRAPSQYSARLSARAVLGDGGAAITVPRLAVTTRSLRWRGAARLDVGEGGAIDVHRFDLRSTAGAVAVKGRLAGGRGDIEARVQRLDLRRVRAALPQDMMPPLWGVVTASASMKLADRAPELAIDASGSVKGLRWTASSPPIDGWLEIDTDFRDVRAELDTRAPFGNARFTADLTLPPRPLSAQSWRQLDRKRLRLVTVTLRRVNLARVALMMPEPPPLEGTLDAAIEIKEGGDDFDVEIHLAGGRAEPLRQPIDIDLTGAGTDRTIEGQLTASLGRRRAVTGKVAIGAGLGAVWDGDVAALEQATLDADLTIPGLPLSRLAATLGINQKLKGMLEGAIEANGTVAEPTLRLDLQVPRATIDQIRGVSVAAKGTLDRARWQIDAGVTHRGGTLNARGRGGTAASSPIVLDLSARGFDLGVVSPAVARAGLPLARIGGRLDLAVDLAGTRTKPRLTGTARLRDVSARMRTGVSRLEKTWLNLDLTRTRLTAVGSARSGSGKAAIRATVGLDDLSPTSLSAEIDANRMPVIAGSMKAAFSGDVEVSGRLRPNLWQIDARVAKGVVRMPERTDTRELHPTGPLEDIRYTDAAAVAARERQRRDEVMGAKRERAIRLRVTTPGGVRIISGDGAMVRANAELDITRIGEMTSIAGTAEAESGEVVLFDRRYRIVRAMAGFDGSTPINPNLDLSLVHEFDTVSLYIGVTGDLEEPVVELTSTPPVYSQSELLGFVLGGTPGEPSQGEGGLRAGATAAASSFLAGQIESIIEKPLPFDTVRIGADEADPGGISSVTVGRWLRDDVFIAYQRRFTAEDDENANEAVVEYHFLPRWMLEGVVGDRGAGSVDVLWIRRF